MDVAVEVSREIMWNIPFWMKVTMYLALGSWLSSLRDGAS